MTTPVDVDALLDYLRSDLVRRDIEEIVRRYKAGQSTRAVGAAVGVSSNTVQRILHLLKVPVRKRGGQTITTPELLAAINERLVRGMSERATAAAVGVSPSLVHELKRKKR